MLNRLIDDLGTAAATPVASLSQVDYKAFYRAKVIAQHVDPDTKALSLDLNPVDTRFAGMQGVPCMFGVPGVQIQVTPGSYVFFGFWNGVPGQTYVSSWDPANAVVEMDLVANLLKLVSPDSNGKAVARVGDATENGTWAVTAVAGAPPTVPPTLVVTFLYTPPTGAPQTQVLTLTGAVTGVVVGEPAQLAGQITTGNDTVLA